MIIDFLIDFFSYFFDSLLAVGLFEIVEGLDIFLILNLLVDEGLYGLLIFFDLEVATLLF